MYLRIDFPHAKNNSLGIHNDIYIILGGRGGLAIELKVNIFAGFNFSFAGHVLVLLERSWFNDVWSFVKNKEYSNV